MSSQVTQNIDEMASLAKSADFETDEKARARALYLSKLITAGLREPEDAAMELCFYPTFAAAARMAIDLKLFHLIAASTGATSAAELEKASGSSEALIIRLLRPLAGLGFVQEAGDNFWIANPITRAMCVPAVEANHIHFWDQGTTSAVKMPAFFRNTGYQQPEDPRNGLFQYAFGTDKEAFELWGTRPGVIDNFNTAMSGVRVNRPSWVEWWPVEERVLKGFEEEDDNGVLLVDIAGGRGHDVQAFKNKFPSRKGRLVLEDLPVVINDIQKLDGDIERVKYDFFTPQPIIGARVYFFHFIMHDWSDDICVKILTQTASTMKRGYSKILLNEFILPDQGCPLLLSGYDLQMMTLHAAQERTETQWKALLPKAGLKIIGFWVPDGGGEGIIEAELA